MLFQYGKILAEIDGNFKGDVLCSDCEALFLASLSHQETEINFELCITYR